MLRSFSRAEIADHLEADHALDPFVPLPQAARIMKASHVLRPVYRRFFKCKSREPDRFSDLETGKGPGQTEKPRNAAGVVISAGSSPDRIVMCSDDKYFFSTVSPVF